MGFNTNFVSISNKIILDDGQLRYDHHEPNQKYRSSFSKDRDRIMYSKSFLRLRGKAQVFMLPKNDYIRTRLTHSLEVCQLAKSIAIALGLNVELVEAIALGHDVGHTPFGHVGERALKSLITEDKVFSDNNKGFKHNLQALRLLCILEKGADFPNYKGLNLTKYTLWGIAHHSSIEQLDTSGDDGITTKHPIYDEFLNKIKSYWSFEGMIVALADELAQRHHDIEDGLRYGIINRKNLLDEIYKFGTVFKKTEKECIKQLQEGVDTLEDSAFYSLFSRLVINMYVNDIILKSKINLKHLGLKYSIANQQDFFHAKKDIIKNDYEKCISMSEALQQLDESFQKFLKNSILFSFQAQALDGKSQYIIKRLYEAFASSPIQLPDTVLRSCYDFVHGGKYLRSDVVNGDFLNENKETLHRCIVDYIGGMTDRYAYDEFDRLYGTRIGY